MTASTDLAPGFRMTEIGPLPEEWTRSTLGDVAALVRKKVHPRLAMGLPYIGLEHLDSGDPTVRRHGSPSDVRSTKGHFQAGDILYGKLRPYLDKAALSAGDGICSTDLLILRAYSERAAPEFLVHLLHTSRFIAHAVGATSGTNHPRTSWDAISRFHMPLPTLPEQRKIVAVLDTVRRAIEATEKVIAAAQELKRSLLQYLFTYGPVPHNQADQVLLKETEIGPMPEGWEVVTVGSLGKVVTGSTPSTKHPEYYGGPHPFITPAELGGRRDVAVTPRTLTDEGLAHTRSVPAGAVLVGCIGSVGKAAIARAAVSATNQQINAVICSESISSEFAYYALTYQAPLMAERAVKTTLPILNKSNFEAIPVPLPLETEQPIMAAMLSVLDAKEAVETDLRSSLETLFRTVLHLLMTGQMRVNDLELPSEERT